MRDDRETTIEETFEILRVLNCTAQQRYRNALRLGQRSNMSRSFSQEGLSIGATLSRNDPVEVGHTLRQGQAVRYKGRSRLQLSTEQSQSEAQPPCCTRTCCITVTSPPKSFTSLGKSSKTTVSAGEVGKAFLCTEDHAGTLRASQWAFHIGERNQAQLAEPVMVGATINLSNLVEGVERGMKATPLSIVKMQRNLGEQTTTRLHRGGSAQPKNDGSLATLMEQSQRLTDPSCSSQLWSNPGMRQTNDAGHIQDRECTY